jgi:cytochrome P450
MHANAKCPAKAAHSDVGTIFNPLDPEQLEDPYPIYARARREEPVFYNHQFDVWVVTRYEDLCTVLRDPECFSSVGALETKPDLSPEIVAVLETGYVKALSLVQSDPPDHTRMRNVFNNVFSPQRVAAMEPQVRAIANKLIDGFEKDGMADLISQFAFPLPGIVICDVLGVPRSDLPQIKRWSNAKQVMMSATETPEKMLEYAYDFVALQHYFREHITGRAKEQKDDLLTLLVPAEIGGTAPLSMQEAVCNAMDLLAAGHETATDLIGNGLALLMDHPKQMADLRADPTLLPKALEEILRMEAPVRGLFRRVTTTVELGGVTLQPGARLFVLYGSGNHDEAEFSRADEFDIHRRKEEPPHLSFSKGIHYCVGSALARLEGRIAFELLLKRLPNVRRDPTRKAVRRPYFILRGFEYLPIVWDTAPSA